MTDRPLGMRGLGMGAAAFCFAFALFALSQGSNRSAMLLIGGTVGVGALGAIARFAPHRLTDCLLVGFIALVAVPVDAYLGYTEHVGGWPGIRVSVSDLLLSVLALTTLLGAIAGTLRNRVPLGLALLMVALLCQSVASAAFAPRRDLALFELASILHSYLIAVLVATLLRRDHLAWVVGVIAAQVVGHSIFAVAQGVTGRPIGAGWLGGYAGLLSEELISGATRFRPAGLFDHPIVYADFLFLSLPILAASLAIRRRLPLRLLLLGGLATGLVGLVLTLSRGAWVSSIAAFAVLAVLALRCHLLTVRQVRLAAIGTISAVLVLAIPFGPRIYERLTQSSPGNVEVRFDLNAIALSMTLANPVFGAGLNNFTEVMEPYDVKGVMDYFPAPVHNLYLLESAEAGVAALLLLCVFFGVVFLRGVRYLLRSQDREVQWFAAALCAGLAGLAVSQLADFSYRLEPLRSIVWCNVGLLLGLTGMSRERPPAATLPVQAVELDPV